MTAMNVPVLSPAGQDHRLVRILIVDDIPQVLHDLRHLLELTGDMEIVYELVESYNPFTAAIIAWLFLGGVMGTAVILFTKKPVWKLALLAVSAVLILALMVPSQ